MVLGLPKILSVVVAQHHVRGGAAWAVGVEALVLRDHSNKGLAYRRVHYPSQALCTAPSQRDTSAARAAQVPRCRSWHQCRMKAGLVLRGDADAIQAAGPHRVNSPLQHLCQTGAGTSSGAGAAENADNRAVELTEMLFAVRERGLAEIPPRNHRRSVSLRTTPVRGVCRRRM